MSIRILIADDHGVVRQGLKMYLELDPELEIVGQAVDGAEALHLARELKPDVVLMDLLMPAMDRSAEISLLDLPRASSRSTSASRLVSFSGLSGAGTSRINRSAT